MARPDVAVLFADPRGVYSNLGVDLWDEARDARLYPGTLPVVAHPPCDRWSVMANCNRRRDGLDSGCFASALASVRAWGGVLEHPAHTLAWPTFDLPRPPQYGWLLTFCNGWVCEVDQGHYGYAVSKRPVAKPTWLYYSGTSPPYPLVWGKSRRPTMVSIGGGGGGRRSLTPPAFGLALIQLARGARTAVAA